MNKGSSGTIVVKAVSIEVYEAQKREIDRLREESAALLSSADDVYKRLMPEVERFREVLNADSQTMRLHLGEMTQQEMRTVKAAFAWVLSRAALKGDE